MHVSERNRARELYKYYTPPDPTFAAIRRPSVAVFEEFLQCTSDATGGTTVQYDAALTAFAQLLALRLDVERAIVSLVDKDQLHILAEVTREMDFRDKFDETGAESLWKGCSQAGREGTTCEKIVELHSTSGKRPILTIPDLSKDDNFKDMPFVTGPLSLRFFCGTPLTTKDGINIGSVFVMDSRVLPEFSAKQEAFLAATSSLIMDQLETQRNSSELQRVYRMSKALSALVEGKDSLAGADKGTPERPQISSQSPKSAPGDITEHSENLTNSSIYQNIGQGDSKDELSLSGMAKKQSPNLSAQSGDIPESTVLTSTEGSALPLNSSSTTSNTEQETSARSTALDSKSELVESVRSTSQSILSDPSPVNTGDSSTKGDDLGHKSVFDRASHLLKDALEVQSCVFLDATLNFTGTLDDLDTDPELLSTDIPFDETQYNIKQESTRIKARHVSSFKKTFDSLNRRGSTTKYVEILGFAGDDTSSLRGDSPASSTDFLPVYESSLFRIMRRYPEGKLFLFDDDGLISSEEDDPRKMSVPPSAAQSQRLARHHEASLLRQVFPGVRQLVFAPLYDSKLGRHNAACFCMSTKLSPQFTADSELAFIKGFLNNVTAEISRVDMLAADRSKGDFIGSISHELRSPLHGILGSAEFLEDTSLDSFQKSLVATQISCGRTLLEVIENILDLSKINSFEKDARGARRRRRSNASAENTNGGKIESLNSLLAPTDVAELCEEVVEGCVAGKAHVWSHISANPFNFLPSSESSEKRLANNSQTSGGLSEFSQPDTTVPVSIILDIDFRENWTFLVQPGALRRIFMNILGNSIKYTSTGYIWVKLETEDIDPGNASQATLQRGLRQTGQSTLILTVTDTGRGISTEFLRSRIFTPFAQEDHLSSGCGLGLSIVRSLVGVHNGKIDIKSQEGVGTSVCIQYPVRPVENRSQISRSPSEMVIAWRPPPGTTAILFTYEDIEQTNSGSLDRNKHVANKLLKESVSNYLTTWLGINVLADIAGTADYGLVFVKEFSKFDPKIVVQHRERFSKLIAILDNETIRKDSKSKFAESLNAFDLIGAPIGPQKLARAMQYITAQVSTHIAPPLTDFELLEDNTTQPKPLITPSALHRRSQNALRAITPSDERVNVESPNSYPFPLVNSIPNSISQIVEIPAKDKTQVFAPTSNPTESHNLRQQQVAQALAIPRRRGMSSSSSTEPAPQAPSLLLVDDNIINLKLLETYVKKRGSHTYHCATNGLLAVEIVEKNPKGFDIIFMDLSMPVLDGLGATRAIRILEAKRRAKAGENAAAPALIIALTGLASSKDQTEAFESGVDLFMMKPVKFKEIGKLLDNWVHNGGLESGSASSSLQAS